MVERDRHSEENASATAGGWLTPLPKTRSLVGTCGHIVRPSPFGILAIRRTGPMDLRPDLAIGLPLSWVLNFVS